MRNFQDAKGRTWGLELTVATAETLKDSLGLDVYELFEPENDILMRLASDDRLAVDVLFVLCEEQVKASLAKDATQTPEREFAGGLNGQAIDDARGVFGLVIADFFPRRRDAIVAMVAKIDEIDHRATEQVVALTNSAEAEARIQTELDKATDDARQLIGGNEPTNSPE